MGLLLLASGLTGQQLSAAPAAEILARVHWLGMNRIGADTNSARFMSVWRLPQTAALAAQTLDKFSRWPGHGATNAASRLLRPLLDDLVSSESCLEICAPANSSHIPQPSTLNPLFALALRLPADRARLWQTNLAAALETLTGVHPVPASHGWVFRQSNAVERIEFSRAGEWTLVGLGPDTHDLLSEFAARIARDRAPSATNVWLEADLDPSRLAAPIPFSASDGEKVAKPDEVSAGRRGEVGLKTISTLNHLISPPPAKMAMSSPEGRSIFPVRWIRRCRPGTIPTNYIHQPLTSFTAVRGLAPWLAAMPAWQKLELTPPPDQAYFWARSGAPFQTYFAAPLPAAGNQLRQLAGRLVQNANPWLATNGEGFFQWQTNPPGLVWNGALILSPNLKPVIVNQQDYVLGGLAPLRGRQSPIRRRPKSCAPSSAPPIWFITISSRPAARLTTTCSSPSCSVSSFTNPSCRPPPLCG